MHANRSALPLAKIALLALGAGLRLWFVRHPNPIDGDPLLYANIARNLLLHGVYSFSPASAPTPLPTLIRLPGYPFFLAAIFRVFGIFHFTAVRVVQVVLDLVGCLVLSVLAQQLFGRRAGWLALALATLCPFTANYTAAPLTETLTLLTITVAFWALAQWLATEAEDHQSARAALAWMAGALACSVLLRPEQGLLCLAVVGAMLWSAGRRLREPRAWVPVLVVSLAIVLPLVPWTARNWRAFHVVEPLAPHYATDPGEPVPLGFQRWFRSWAIDFASTEEVYWNYDGTQILLSDLPARAFDTEAQRAATATLLDKYNETTTPTAEFDRCFEALAWERMRGHWSRYYVWLPLARLGNMLLRPRTELMNTQLAWWRWRENPGQAVFALLYAALNAVYLGLGVWGAARWWRLGGPGNRTVLGAMLAFVALRCALLLTLDNSEPRYTLEFFPVWIITASALVSDRGHGTRA